jgi:alpha-L-arabinofuranosidase
VVNPHVREPRETEIGIRGGSLQSGTATTLTHSDIHAHNSFAEREVVSPKASAVEFTGTGLTYSFPPASVTKLVLRVG